MTVFDRIQTLLTAKGIAFAVDRHAPVFTSEEAARVRGTALSSGAKALVLKIDDAFSLLVLPADRKLDSKGTKKALKAKSIRFATKEEVLEITGLLPGSIPPFGSLFGLKTIVDPALRLNESINFNAGEHAISISMKCIDYLLAEEPREQVISES
jgi:Ala-tRNA(Pro) deacylase